VRDRIKAVLLKSEGWTQRQIAQALRIHEETVRQHIKDWIREEKLKPQNGGSWSKLTENQTREIANHLEKNLYTKVVDICAYVDLNYKVHYTVSGMTKWLHQKPMLKSKKRASKNTYNCLMKHPLTNLFFLWIQLIPQWQQKFLVVG